MHVGVVNLDVPVPPPVASRANRPQNNAPVTGSSADTARLHAWFLAAGSDAFSDVELLRLVLTPSLPSDRNRTVAERLIATFGSFAGVIAAPAAKLQAVCGVSRTTAVNLKLVQAAAIRLSRQELATRPLFGRWDKVIDYCRAAMAHEPVEQLRLLFLDRKNRLIADEVQQHGTVDHTPVYPREVIKRALELDATALIIVHNHPSGDAVPSRADVQMTRELQTLTDGLGIALHDHIIIARSGHASLRALGLI